MTETTELVDTDVWEEEIVFRVSFHVADAAPAVHFTRDEALWWLTWNDVREGAVGSGGVVLITQLDDEGLARALADHAEHWLTQRRGGWIRVADEGEVDAAIFAIRADHVAVVRVEIQTRPMTTEAKGPIEITTPPELQGIPYDENNTYRH